MSPKVEVDDVAVRVTIEAVADKAKEVEALGLELGKVVVPIISLNPVEVPTFKSENGTTVNPTLNTDIEVLNVEGKGIFYSGTIKTDDAATVIIRYLKVWLDGVLIMFVSASEAGNDTWHVKGIIGIDILSKTAPSLNVNLKFNDTLVVAVRTSDTLVAGKYLAHNILYGEQ